jgi:bifunctional DNA-binding transcriptional regulator/antitoxin component of YhaV-PrlF toxin-antitoxin module
VTIPIELRRKLGIEEGGVVAFIETEDGILLSPREVLAMDALDRIGEVLREELSLEELLDTGREIRGQMVEEEYGLEVEDEGWSGSSPTRVYCSPPAILRLSRSNFGGVRHAHVPNGTAPEGAGSSNLYLLSLTQYASARHVRQHADQPVHLLGGVVMGQTDAHQAAAIFQA